MNYATCLAAEEFSVKLLAIHQNAKSYSLQITLKPELDIYIYIFLKCWKIDSEGEIYTHRYSVPLSTKE
jgi:hypothetical protein